MREDQISVFVFYQNCMFNLPPHVIYFLNEPQLTFSEKKICSLNKAVLDKMKNRIFLDELPIIDASGDGTQEFCYVANVIVAGNP